MVTLFICGLVCFVFGIMFLFFPSQLTKFSSFANRFIMQIDEKMFKLRIGIGISMTAIGIVCFFLMYYFLKK